MRTPLRYLIAAACLLAGSFAFAAEDAKAEPNPDLAKTAALSWLKLIDDEKYEDSWKEAAAYFQGRVTAQAWSERLSQIRRPLGHTDKREFKEANFVHEAPRLPKGDYWQIQYATSIEGTAVIETATVTLDKDGKWHVLSYQIKQAS
ncbi:MAG TPA: DUF4019 domain-containing protein [Candidatus Didemnitutus sp.]|nr:DUF4019 domain-containing protein [Candidatus Didemnitutus sp.]